MSDNPCVDCDHSGDVAGMRECRCLTCGQGHTLESAYLGGRADMLEEGLAVVRKAKKHCEEGARGSLLPDGPYVFSEKAETLRHLITKLRRLK